MKKPILNFWRMTVPKKIQKSREIVIHMTGNTNYTTPNPTLTAVTTAINALETSFEAAADGGKVLKAAVRAKEKILDDLMSQLLEYVANVSGGDEQKILSAGFDVKAVSIHSKRMPSVVAGKNTGEAVCTAITPVRGIKASHEWQYCRDPILPDTKADIENTWIEADVTTAATVTLKNLPAGVKLWFRHRYIFSKGNKGQWTVLGSLFVAP